MPPVTKIAIRRLRRGLYKNILLSVAVLFSFAVMSVLIFFELQMSVAGVGAYKDLPFDEFAAKLEICINITVLFLVIITAVTFRLHCGMRADENAPLLAVLTGIGATELQKSALINTDIFLLYLPSIVLGTFLGAPVGIIAGNSLFGVYGRSDIPAYAFTAAVIVFFGFLLSVLCSYLPTVSFKKGSVIGAVRRQNPKASAERHGYRSSETYRRGSLLRRLARKSSDYYHKAYGRIALSFAIAALYPLLAVMLFVGITGLDVVIDINPYDGADTFSAVMEALENIIFFLGFCFAALAVIGALQAMLMTKMHALERRSTARTYLSIGMTSDDLSKMIRYELLGVTFKVCVILLFSVLVIGTFLGMAVS